MKSMDKNGDDKLCFDEYVALCKVVDKDGSGCIDEKELKAFMKKSGCSVSKKELKQMLKDADTDNDGRVNFEEFVKVVFG